MGHRLQQFLPFGRIIDLGEFLRQIQVILADDAILDEPFAGFGHLLVFLLRRDSGRRTLASSYPRSKEALCRRLLCIPQLPKCLPRLQIACQERRL